MSLVQAPTLCLVNANGVATSNHNPYRHSASSRLPLALPTISCIFKVLHCEQEYGFLLPLATVSSNLPFQDSSNSTHNVETRAAWRECAHPCHPPNS
jgi:hypothetical protein